MAHAECNHGRKDRITPLVAALAHLEELEVLVVRLEARARRRRRAANDRQSPYQRAGLHAAVTLDEEGAEVVRRELARRTGCHWRRRRPYAEAEV